MVAERAIDVLAAPCADYRQAIGPVHFRPRPFSARVRLMDRSQVQQVIKTSVLVQ